MNTATSHRAGTPSSLYSVALPVAVLAVLGSALAPPAQADEFDPLSIVESQGLLADPNSPDSRAAQVPDQSNQTQAESEAASLMPIEITPVTQAPASTSEDGASTIHVDGSTGFVTGTAAGGTNASFVVLNDETAPNAHQFEVGDSSTSLEVHESGGAVVKDASGTQINFLQAPWATDATGKQLATHYTVEGNIVTQHIDTTGATYPVTADPTTGCGVGWCSVYFNRTETSTIAAAGPAGTATIAAGCALAGPIAAGVCAVAGGAITTFAIGADANNNCVGLVAYGVPPLASWNPFVESKGSAHCP